MIIGAIGVVVAYNLHYWVERKFKIDDAVGAVAVHGYAGVAGLIICGFVLWGYPSSGYSVGSMWVGTDYAPINPIGMSIGAIIMFVVLGFLPGWIIAKVLHGMGKLRIPREVELAGLDYEIMEAAKDDEKAVSSATR
jgi:ammonia channel protein AmtB